MTRGRRAVSITLSDAELEALRRWERRGKTSQALALRSRIVLLAAEGLTNEAISGRLAVTPHTASKWRRRFAERRLDGLLDEPRCGAPRTYDDAAIEDVIVKTLEETPADATHWSRTSMGKRTGMSESTVGRIWATFGLKPHRMDYWKLSTDPQFIEKLRDVVGLYLSPPDNAALFCVDEKSQTQALERSAPILPVLPGTPARMSHDYVRHGTTSLFTALEVATGKVITQCRPTHTSNDFRNFLNKVNREVPEELDVHVILDNYGTHKSDMIARWQARHPRFHFHFIPTYSSWLNLVERWFSALTTKLLQRSSHRSTGDLERDILGWADRWNTDPKPFVWVKTADEILESIAKYLNPIYETNL